MSSHFTGNGEDEETRGPNAHLRPEDWWYIDYGQRYQSLRTILTVEIFSQDIFARPFISEFVLFIGI